ncbi:MAG: hypothetical protein MZV64_42255 [Ignavibacteriales bacterium]|nr:hypothetical protein [Ignavibacteriales bacterium]
MHVRRLREKIPVLGDAHRDRQAVRLPARRPACRATRPMTFGGLRGRTLLAVFGVVGGRRWSCVGACSSRCPCARSCCARIERNLDRRGAPVPRRCCGTHAADGSRRGARPRGRPRSAALTAARVTLHRRRRPRGRRLGRGARPALADARQPRRPARRCVAGPAPRAWASRAGSARRSRTGCCSTSRSPSTIRTSPSSGSRCR